MFILMALPIKFTPTLTGKAAKRFNEIADRNYRHSKIPKEDLPNFIQGLKNPDNWKEIKKEEFLQILSKDKL